MPDQSIPHEHNPSQDNSPLDRVTVNLFRGSRNPAPIDTLSLAQALEAIRTGTYRKPIEDLRRLLASQGKKAYDRAKRTLEAVTFGGTFSPTRAKANLTLHSGIVHGDLDYLTDLEAAKRSLTVDPYVLYCFVSPSGPGLKVGVRVDPVADDTAYKLAWQAVADAHQRDYGLMWDPSGKDISRLCYVSWDPELYVHAEVPLFPVPARVVPPPRPPTPPRTPRPLSADRRARYAEQALKTAIDIIDRSIPGNRHEHRLKASELLGGYVGGGILSYDEAWGALAQAVERNTDDVERSLKTIADGLQHGQGRAITLDELEAERQAWLDQHGPQRSPHRHISANGHGQAAPQQGEGGTDEPPMPPPDDGDIADVPGDPALYGPAKLTLADKLTGMTRDPDTGELSTSEHAARRALEWAQEGEHLTEFGNAKRLVLQHGSDVRYCHPWKTWLVWDGTRWQRDATAEVVRRGKQTVASIYAEAAAAPDKATRTLLAQFAMKSEKASQLGAMIALAQSEPGIPVLPEALDRDHWALNVLNGTVDLQTGELRPHRREDLLTKLAPVQYDPQALSDVWETFLTRILPDAELRAFVHRALGYTITGTTSEEVLFFPYGPTATGKSTLLCAVAAALGEYALTADFATFLARDRVMGGPRNDIAQLDGRRFVLSLEVDEGTHLAESILKQLTGGDTVRARFLYQESFEFLPTFTLWLAANHRPLVRDDDDAIWRRILQIAFDQQIPVAERDPQVKATLRDPARSGPAILAWLVQGCLAWQREGLRVPKAVKDTTQQYRNEMDPLRDFLVDRCTINSTAQATRAALWAAYEGWAKATGVRALGSRQFIDRLRRMGFDEDRNRKSRFWIGVSVLGDTSDTSDTKSRNFELPPPTRGELREKVTHVTHVTQSAEPPEREPGEEG